MTKSLLIVGTSHTAGACHEVKPTKGKKPSTWLTKEQRWFHRLYEHYDEIELLCRPGASPLQQLLALRQYMVNNPDKRFTNCILEGRTTADRYIELAQSNVDTTADMADKLPDEKHTITTYDYFRYNNGDDIWYEQITGKRFQELIKEVHPLQLYDTLTGKADHAVAEPDVYTQNIMSAIPYYINDWQDSWAQMIIIVSANIAMLSLMETISERALFFPFNNPIRIKGEKHTLERKAWATGVYDRWSLEKLHKKDFPLEMVEVMDREVLTLCKCGHANSFGCKIISDEFTPRILKYFNRG